MANMNPPGERSNVLRFPTIGMHLIDDATPAHAPTEAPEAAHAATDIGADSGKPRRGPLAIIVDLACVVALVGWMSVCRPWVLVSLIVLLPLAMVAGWAAWAA